MKFADQEKLRSFLCECADVVINENGNTVKEEVGQIAKLAALAATDAIRTSEDDFSQQSSQRTYLAAGKKILFLNSMARKLTGQSFITQIVEKNKMDDLTKEFVVLV